ncbi:11707_t:CDS:2, partial [Funneliformis geosporum]
MSPSLCILYRVIANILKRKIERLPIDEELVPDILTMMLTFNTERDKSKDISIDEPFEPMSNVNICDNLSEIVVGAIDT